MSNGMPESSSFRSALSLLYGVRSQFMGASIDSVPIEIWRQYLNLVVRICKVEEAAFYSYSPGQPDLLFCSKEDAHPNWVQAIQAQEFSVFLARTQETGFAIKPPAPQSSHHQTLVAIRCHTTRPSYLVLALKPSGHDQLQEVLLRAQLLADCVNDSAATSKGLGLATPHLSLGHDILPMLGLLAEIYQASQFQAAAYSLVNGIAAQSPEVDQVIMGWRDGPYMRAKAISHYERFERKTDTVKLFEASLEESADQSASISFGIENEHQSDPYITHAHNQLKVHLSAKHLFTFPVFDAQGQAVLTLMLVSYRHQVPDNILEATHFLAQTALPRLEQLAQKDAPLTTRIRTGFETLLKRLRQRDNMAVKAVATSFAVLLLSSFILTGKHQIEATGQFITDNTRLVTAPFDSTIQRVWVTSGDVVQLGGPLIELDTQDLAFQLAELQAELQRHTAEADKARATFSSVELAISSARADQVRAKVERIRLMLSQSRIASPLSGVVVEGDRRDLLSAPVTKGQPLIRVAQSDGLYLTLLVSDEDIQHVSIDQMGAFSLISQPNIKIPIRVKTVVPMASADAVGGAKFKVLAHIEQEAPDWWRPGMTGVAKIEVGRRTWIWLWTHKLINRIRLFLW